MGAAYFAPARSEVTHEMLPVDVILIIVLAGGLYSDNHLRDETPSLLPIHAYPQGLPFIHSAYMRLLVFAESHLALSLTPRLLQPILRHCGRNLFLFSPISKHLLTSCYWDYVVNDTGPQCGGDPVHQGLPRQGG